MRIFSINRKMQFDGTENLESINCNLTRSDVVSLVTALSSFKTKEPILESNIKSITECLTPLISKS